MQVTVNAGRYVISPELENIMGQERDDFLTSMPDGLQDRQNRAIRRAMKGDSSSLKKVRESRNTPYTPSQNVEAIDLKIGYEGFVLSGEGLNARLYRPADRKEGEMLPLLVYFHGGGWVLGSINSCAAFCDALASTGKVMVLAVDYRLAPEYPFPAALEDCVATTYYAMRKAGEWGSDMENVSIGGDSSGGNLAIMTGLTINNKSAKIEGLSKVKSLVVFYPVTKAYDDGSESWNEYGDFYGLDSEIMETFNAAYLSGTGKLDQEEISQREKLVSPSDLDMDLLTHLPEILLIAAGKDILRDQGRDFMEKVKEAGIKGERVEFSEAAHLFITVPGQPSAFNEAVRLTSEFLNPSHR